MKYMKIIATVKPTTPYKTLEALCRAGASVFRLNFSHIDTTQDDDLFSFRNNIDKLKRGNYAIDVAVDNRGPEIRTIVDIECKEGDLIYFSSSNISRRKYERVLSRMIYIDDGKYLFFIEEITLYEICARAKGDYKIPKGKSLSQFFEDSGPYLHEEDMKIFNCATKHNFHIFFLSFIRRSSDVVEIKRFFDNYKTVLIAKIENLEGAHNIKDILNHADGYMIARGDLFMNLTYINSYRIYSGLLRFMTEKIKIVATGMANNMIRNSTLSAAEIVDISVINENLADAVLLTNETILAQRPDNVVLHVSEVIKANDIYCYSNIYGKFTGGSYRTVNFNLSNQLMHNTQLYSFYPAVKKIYIRKYRMEDILKRDILFIRDEYK